MICALCKKDKEVEKFHLILLTDEDGTQDFSLCTTCKAWLINLFTQ